MTSENYSRPQTDRLTGDKSSAHRQKNGGSMNYKRFQKIQTDKGTGEIINFYRTLKNERLPIIQTADKKLYVLDKDNVLHDFMTFEAVPEY
jgi:hypothetical protein